MLIRWENSTGVFLYVKPLPLFLSKAIFVSPLQCASLNIGSDVVVNI